MRLRLRRAVRAQEAEVVRGTVPLLPVLVVEAEGDLLAVPNQGWCMQRAALVLAPIGDVAVISPAAVVSPERVLISGFLRLEAEYVGPESFLHRLTSTASGT